MMTAAIRTAVTLRQQGKIDAQTYLVVLKGEAKRLEPIADTARLTFPVQLYHTMEALRYNPYVPRTHPLIGRLYRLLEESRPFLPEAFCEAVRINLDAFDGQRVPGLIMRTGLLAVPQGQAALYGIAPCGQERMPGTTVLFPPLPSPMLKPEPFVYPGGYTGTYTELWHQLLSPAEQVDALRRVVVEQNSLPLHTCERVS